MTTEPDLDTLINYASSLTQLKLSAGKYYGLCPIHGEKTGSFTIDTKSGRWKCYGCQATGSNAIWLYMEINGCNFQEAKRALGLWDNSRRAPKPRPPAPPSTFSSTNRAECYRVARWTLTHHLDCTITHNDIKYLNHQFVFNCLFDNPDPLPYLNKILEEIQTNPDPTADRWLPLGPWFAECFINDACRLFAVRRATETT